MINWEKLPGQVINVISDIHSNAAALTAVLNTIKQQRNDQLIILGDILSYGIDTQLTMDMIQKSMDDGALLLMGNHDQMYLELVNGHCKMFERLRPDLQESIMYNFNKLDTKQFSNWSWQQEIIRDNIFFSHANPFGDLWSYINDVYDFQEAAKKIKKLGHIAGVFGHTHRDKYFSIKNSELKVIEDLSDDTFILNPGSIGQPRSIPRQATILRLSSYNNKLWAEIEPIHYDMQKHIDGLISSSLSETTKTKLISFFKE